MKAAWVLVLVAAASAVAVQGRGGTSIDDDAPYDLTQAPKLFVEFMKRYHRDYKDAVETNNHYVMFVKNLMFMNEAAKYQKTVKLGINNFADMTTEEKKRWLGFNDTLSFMDY